MTSYNEFCSEFPIKELNIKEKTFQYRHYNNPDSEITLVLLVGGLGISDLMYNHFIKFSKYFSVITFDYSMNYQNNEELTNAIHELLTHLNIRAWFVGQSLGGFIAQLMAIKYPDVVEGLALSNTGCASENLSETAYQSLMDMIKSSNKSKKIVNLIPFSLFKKLISKKVMKRYGANFNSNEKAILKDVCIVMEQKLTKKYEIHMINLLIDLQNNFGSKKEQFKYLNDKVLLILSDDDKTFHDEVKIALIDIMPSPKVITDLKGGHISLMINCDEYVSMIVEYITGRL